MAERYRVLFVVCAGAIVAEACGGDTGSFDDSHDFSSGDAGRIDAGTAGSSGGTTAGSAGIGVGAGGGAGSGGAVATAGTSGAGGQLSASLACESPEVVLDNGQPTGFIRCLGGWLHRTERLDCPTTAALQPCLGAYEGECAFDVNCAAQPNGRCAVFPSAVTSCRCQYGCVDDADCGPGNLCACVEGSSQCAPAECGIDSECPAGSLCASYATSCSGAFRFACTTPAPCADGG